ncbi:MAG TPA: 16S rRNA (cytidine(1402)-2'-O)-methyltransferase [Acidimicrobiales bacterium]|nr:16S rRNA (cytidine(1402)-2'-O)-methyltransferase [Acidimicrobiales bacterium]
MDEVKPGQLVLVATPLGNLGDLSRRALELFETADVIYCEDTRHSRTLFSAHDIALRGRLHSLHQHNEAAQCAQIVARVRAGDLVVLISDAGTPGISDPGSRVVAAVIDAGLVVTTAPGPSAVVAALTISGLPTERFIMEGFLSRKAGERAKFYEQWAREERTVVFYESPQRLKNVLRELADRFPNRRVAIAREMTKLHEEVLRGTFVEVLATLADRDVLGEIVVVLEGVTLTPEVDDDAVRSALVEQFQAGVSTRDAVDYVAELLDVARRDVYQLALELRKAEPL